MSISGTIQSTSEDNSNLTLLLSGRRIVFTDTQEQRHLPWFFLSTNMTLSFTSFSIEDILTGRDIVRGPAGGMSTGGQSAPQPAAGNLCADIKTRNLSLGGVEQGRCSDNLCGNEDTTKFTNTKGEQQTRHVYNVITFVAVDLPFINCSFLSLKLFWSGKKTWNITWWDHNDILINLLHQNAFMKMMILKKSGRLIKYHFSSSRPE